MSTSGSGAATGTVPIPAPSVPSQKPSGRALYPTASVLTEALVGLPTLDGDRAARAIEAGIDQFERETGRHFLAGRDVNNTPKAEEARRFEPPRQGTLSIPDLWSVASVQYEPMGTTPETWTEPDDYMLVSSVEGSDDPPYRAIEVARYICWPARYHLRRSLVITGLWGYGDRIPDDAYMAMLTAGMVTYLGIGRLTAGGYFPLKSWTAPGGVSQTYDTSFIAAEAAAYMAAVANYRRLEL